MEKAWQEKIHRSHLGYLEGRRLVEEISDSNVPGKAKYLVAILDSHGTELRREAVKALGKTDSQEALSALLRCLQASDSRVREAAAEGVGRLGQREHISALEPLTDDTNVSVRLAAEDGISRLSRLPVKPNVPKQSADESSANEIPAEPSTLTTEPALQSETMHVETSPWLTPETQESVESLDQEQHGEEEVNLASENFTKEEAIQTEDELRAETLGAEPEGDPLESENSDSGAGLDEVEDLPVLVSFESLPVMEKQEPLLAFNSKDEGTIDEVSPPDEFMAALQDLTQGLFESGQTSEALPKEPGGVFRVYYGDLTEQAWALWGKIHDLSLELAKSDHLKFVAEENAIQIGAVLEDDLESGQKVSQDLSHQIGSLKNVILELEERETSLLRYQSNGLRRWWYNLTHGQKLDQEILMVGDWLQLRCSSLQALEEDLLAVQEKIEQAEQTMAQAASASESATEDTNVLLASRAKLHVALETLTYQRASVLDREALKQSSGDLSGYMLSLLDACLDSRARFAEKNEAIQRIESALKDADSVVMSCLANLSGALTECYSVQTSMVKERIHFTAKAKLRRQGFFGGTDVGSASGEGDGYAVVNREELEWKPSIRFEERHGLWLKACRLQRDLERDRSVLLTERAWAKSASEEAVAILIQALAQSGRRS